MLAYFKQLMEYKTFHCRKVEEAANMINLIKTKIKRRHTTENPVIKGRSILMGGYNEAYK